VVSLFFSFPFALELKFLNLLGYPLVLHWDSYGSSPDAKGLILMGEIPPFVPYPINTHPRHIFEVQLFSGATIELIQALPFMDTFEIYPTRHCDIYEGLQSNLVIEMTQCSAYLEQQMNHFQQIALPLYRANQILSPDKNVLIQRDQNEQRRVWLNRNQPKLTPKFTELGYGYAELPDTAWRPLVDFWNQNKQKMEMEKWKPQDHHVNHWESPTYVLFLPNNIQSAILRSVQPILEKWIGGKIPLEYTALYGIRIYKNNSYLLNHVDRSATHAISVIIQVDQKVDEDWMLEVIGHDGKTEHLKLSPKQMILYESASVIHGRPEKFKGDYYANVFAHFRPKHGWHLDSL